MTSLATLLGADLEKSMDQANKLLTLSRKNKEKLMRENLNLAFASGPPSSRAPSNPYPPSNLPSYPPSNLSSNQQYNLPSNLPSNPLSAMQTSTMDSSDSSDSKPSKPIPKRLPESSLGPTLEIDKSKIIEKGKRGEKDTKRSHSAADNGQTSNNDNLKSRDATFNSTSATHYPTSATHYPTSATHNPTSATHNPTANSLKSATEMSLEIMFENDKLVRQQQEIILQQSKRQILGIQELQEIQLDAMAKIFQKQVSGFQHLNDDVSSVLKQSSALNSQSKLTTLQSSIPKLTTQPSIPKLTTQPSIQKMDTEDMPPPPQPYRSSTSEDKENVKSNAQLSASDIKTQERKEVLENVLEKARKSKSRLDLSLLGEVGGLDNDTSKALKTLILEPEMTKIGAQVDEIERNVDKVLKIVQSKSHHNYEKDYSGSDILQGLLNQVGKIDVSPLDKYLPVFSQPVFTNKALPQVFDYGTVQRDIKHINSTLEIPTPLVATRQSNQKVPTEKEDKKWKLDTDIGPITIERTRPSVSPTKKPTQKPTQPQTTTKKSQSKTPVPLAQSDPSLLVSGSSLSILKTLLPLRSTSRSTSPVKTETSGRPSLQRYDSTFLKDSKRRSDPVFIRRCSIRPASLGFFGHGVVGGSGGDGFGNSSARLGSSLEISDDVGVGAGEKDGVPSPPSKSVTSQIQTTTTVQEKTVTPKTSTVNGGVVQQEQKLEKKVSVHDMSVQYYEPNRDVSLQYSTPDETSTDSEWINGGITLNKPTTTVQNTRRAVDHSVDGKKEEKSMEERLAEWVQTEVLLSLIRKEGDSLDGVSETKPLDTAVTQNEPLQVQTESKGVDQSTQIKVDLNVEMSTQTAENPRPLVLQDVTFPSQSFVFNAADVVAEISQETPLDVSSMDPSVSVSIAPPPPQTLQSIIDGGVQNVTQDQEKQVQIESEMLLTQEKQFQIESEMPLTQEMQVQIESEMSLTTQPSSLLDELSSRLYSSREQGVQVIQQWESSLQVTSEPGPVLEKPIEISESQLNSLVEKVIVDVSRTELVSIVSSSIIEAHQSHVRAKTEQLDLELESVRSTVRFQTSQLNDAFEEARLRIGRFEEPSRGVGGGILGDGQGGVDQLTRDQISEKESDEKSDKERSKPTIKEHVSIQEYKSIISDVEQSRVVTERDNTADDASLSSAIPSFSDPSSSTTSSSKEKDPNSISLTISSLPTLSEGEILTQFYSQGELIERRAKQLVPSASLTNPPVVDQNSSSEPTTSSGQLTSEGQVSLLRPVGPEAVEDDYDASVSSNQPLSLLQINAAGNQTTLDGIDLSVTLERISMIIPAANESSDLHEGSTSG